MAMETLFSTDEAARRLKVSVQTLRKRIKNGDIRAHWAGKQFLVPESALQEYLSPAPVEPRGKSPSPQADDAHMPLEDSTTGSRSCERPDFKTGSLGNEFPDNGD
jgi:excisionase family DNA binding protein